MILLLRLASGFAQLSHLHLLGHKSQLTTGHMSLRPARVLS